MDLNIVWFILIAVLYSGYFIFEGFDFGVGMLLPFIAKDDTRRRVVLNTIGPHWDGNEVWLITAGGATFAAFPMWYASLFSGFYLPLFLMLLGLIFRGIAIEYRSKDENPIWRSVCDWAIFTGSLLVPLLWGVAFTNIVSGVPIDGNMVYVGGFFNLLNPHALLGGLMLVAVFLLHGANFLSLRVEGKLLETVRKAISLLWIPALVLAGIYLLATAILLKSGIVPIVTSVIAALVFLASAWLLRQKREGWAFISLSIVIALVVSTLFINLFPNVFVSSLNPDWSLTIYNAASGTYTLQVMTIVAMIFVPIVLAYQAYRYWAFRFRISEKERDLEY